MGRIEKNKRSVLLIHNFLTPYRVPLFTELAARFDLEVWILGDVAKIREWSSDAAQDAFKCRFMPHVGIPTGSRDYRVVLNYTFPVSLARHEHDVIIVCGWDTPASVYAVHYSKLTGKPVVLWAGSTAREPNWRRTMSRPLVGNLVRRADAWLSYGTRSKDYLVSLGANADKVFRAFNTVETTQFANQSSMMEEQRDSFKNQLGITSKYVVFYCGQLIERKGLQDLLPGFAKLVESGVDVTLLVAGSGKCESQFRNQVKGLGLTNHVMFAGFVERDELPRYYGISDLFTLPSREEVWGLVINEALACGVPVLTTEAVGASADLMEDGVNGYVCPAGNAEALGAALLRHFSKENDLQQMQRAARESILPFTISHAADAFEQAVEAASERG